MASISLARYACDYCKQKKLRCSKELPKCSACKPWPGPCDYSRDAPAPKPNRDNLAPVPLTMPSHQEAEGIHSRLDKLEKAIQNLTDTVTKALDGMGEVVSSHAGGKSKTNMLTIPKDDAAANLVFGDSHSFSILKDASASIRVSAPDSDPLHRQARDELQYLSNAITTTVVAKGVAETNFYIPPRAEGYQLIGKFLENASLGDNFFQAPSEDLLIQVIFKPETVTRKAWVVYVNYMLLAMLSGDKNTRAQNFRQNMKLALNDSSIFLEPHEAHLQALILLAIHGEDYSSPSSSWMLVGHACRQAQVLGLHLSTNVEYEIRQRRLSLFWLLFAIDRSCSLAFGRPCFLPSDVHSQVPLPDFSYLTRFEPRSDLAAAGKTKRQSSMFGAHMFLARIELASLTSNDYSRPNNEGTAEGRGLLRANLVEWHARTVKILQDTLDNERSLSSPNQLHEMLLGISTVKFEYLNTLMAFTNGDPSSSNLRLEAAREAISLLPSMVSNWTSLFNSMIWHLLYFPFIPYFIIYGHLMKDHASLSARTIQQDTGLLATAVSYYANMRGQMQLLAPLCARLENVANVFLRLVQHEVNGRGALEKAEICSQGAMQSLRAREPIGGRVDIPVMPVDEMRQELSDGISADLEHYLEWLPTDLLPTHPVISQEMRNSASDKGPVYERAPSDQGSRGTKRPFDVMFDWFAWDVYYADNK
ncbi:hypothetical protein FAVG1_10807 [Fusarium avenaceum]|nr:hypothetical protein FAVG1_10807 [Fusarium avenaceum]